MYRIFTRERNKFLLSAKNEIWFVIWLKISRAILTLRDMENWREGHDELNLCWWKVGGSYKFINDCTIVGGCALCYRCAATSTIVQFLPFWGDVTISFLAFSLLKRQKQKKTKKRHVYLLMVTLRLFYAPVNLTIFNFFHLLHSLQT
jgi:hypothetical protein